MKQAQARNEAARSGFRLFRIGGIDIRIDYSWFLIFLLVLWSLSSGYFPRVLPDQSAALYWVAGLVATLVFFLSILAHELSHSWMAIRSGIAIPAITLFLFGGVSHMEEEPQDPRTEVKIAIVGPLMSFALAGLFWGLRAAFSLEGLAGTTLEYLAFINAALGVFNLLPGFPLDGGRVFRALAWWRTGSLERGTKLASDMGKGLALGIMFLGAVEIFAGALLGGVWLIFIGMFLRGMADAGFQQLMVRRALGDVSVREVMIEEPVSVGPDTTIQELIEEGFLRHGYRGFPVVESGKVRGVISIDDVKGLPEEERRSGRVADHMQHLSEALEISPDASLAGAVAQMGRQSAPRLLVIRDGRLLGMLTKTGLSRFIELRRILESG